MNLGKLGEKVYNFIRMRRPGLTALTVVKEAVFQNKFRTKLAPGIARFDLCSTTRSRRSFLADSNHLRHPGGECRNPSSEFDRSQHRQAQAESHGPCRGENPNPLG